MGWRFRKSFRVAPGVRINVSNRGVSATIGGSALSFSVVSSGTFANVSLPGTGISCRERLTEPAGFDGSNGFLFTRIFKNWVQRRTRRRRT